MKNPLTLAVLCLAALVPPSESRAAIVASWDVAGLTDSGPSPFAPTTLAAHVFTDGWIRGAAVTTGSADNVWGGASFDSLTKAAAISAENLLSFSLQPAIGYTLAISEISAFPFKRSGSGPVSGQWQYSLADSWTDIGSEMSWGTLGTATNSGNSSALALSGIAELQNIGGGQSVHFRLVNWGTTSDTGTWYIRNLTGADFELQGSVSAVPEPASLASLAILGVVAFVARSMRYQRCELASVGH